MGNSGRVPARCMNRYNGEMNIRAALMTAVLAASSLVSCGNPTAGFHPAPGGDNVSAQETVDRDQLRHAPPRANDSAAIGGRETDGDDDDFAAKENGADQLAARAPGGTDGYKTVRAVSTYRQNEPAIAVEPDNPGRYVVAMNDFRDQMSFTVKGAGVPYLVYEPDASDFNKAPISIPVRIAWPKVFRAPSVVGGRDPAVAFDAKKPGVAYYAFLVRDENDMDKNSVQLATFDLSKVDPVAGQTGQLGVYVVAGHAGRPGGGGDSPVEDKEEIAVNPENGTILVTDTQNGKDPHLNAYFLQPLRDGSGTPTGQFKLLNPGGKPILINDKSETMLQFTQPAFLPGGKAIVAYSEGHFSNGKIRVGVQQNDGSFKTVDAARIVNDLRFYFSAKFDEKFHTQFRSTTQPSVAVDPANGTAYIVYDDAGEGLVWGKDGDTSALPGPHSRTMLVRSTDGGNTWSRPQSVGGADQGGPARDHWMSAISIDPKTGALAAGFVGIGDDGNFAPYVTISIDGGKTWSKPEQVYRDSNFMNDRFNGGFSGDYTSIAIASERNVSNGSTSFHVYYAHPSDTGDDDPTVQVSQPRGGTPLTYSTASLEQANPRAHRTF